MIYGNGDKYEGTWHKGQRHGNGTIVFVAGIIARYEGEWQNDKISGKGVMEFRNGNRYEGHVKNNCVRRSS
jgi:hypothetical protein